MFICIFGKAPTSGASPACICQPWSAFLDHRGPTRPFCNWVSTRDLFSQFRTQEFPSICKNSTALIIIPCLYYFVLYCGLFVLCLRAVLQSIVLLLPYTWQTPSGSTPLMSGIFRGQDWAFMRHVVLIIHNILPFLKHMPTVPVVVVGKEGRTKIGPWSHLIRNIPFVELPWELLSLCWWILGSECDR